MTDKLDIHAAFLRLVSLPDGPVHPDTAQKALATWQACVAAVPERFFPPGAAASENGHVIYCWDTDTVHLAAEFIPGQPTERFYQNDLEKRSWYEESDELPARAADAIREIFRLRTAATVEPVPAVN